MRLPRMEAMFVQLAVGVSRFVQRERERDVDVKFVSRAYRSSASRPSTLNVPHARGFGTQENFSRPRGFPVAHTLRLNHENAPQRPAVIYPRLLDSATQFPLIWDV